MRVLATEAASSRPRRRRARRRSARSSPASSRASPSGKTTRPIAREVFVNIPDPIYWLFYATVAVMLFASRVADRAAGPQLRARRARRPPHDQGRTCTGGSRDFRAGVWMRTLLRDPAAGRHALVHLLRLPRAVRGHDHPRDRPPAARGAEVPARRRVPGVRRHRRHRSASSSSSASLWAIGRRYVQRPYRIRIKTKPEDAVILGTFLVIGVTGFLTEGFRIALEGRPSFEAWSFVGYPLRRARRRRGRPSTLARPAPHDVGRALRRVRRVPRDPADDEAAPHGHVADEHVPARQRTGPRAR